MTFEIVYGMLRISCSMRTGDSVGAFYVFPYISGKTEPTSDIIRTFVKIYINRYMTPKVSIIVPIYNAGKFLEKCLDTLVNQTLKDIEIILVLDCPTDGSDRIAREYAEKDPRIRLIINEQNLNIGLSRNEGLKIARGEYIGFSDHDDWRELDMYEKLYQKAREDQADIAISNFDSIYPDRIIPHPYYPDCPNQEQLKQEIFSHLIGDWKKEQEWRPFTHWGYMWHILYKREILENHNIWFL